MLLRICQVLSLVALLAPFCSADSFKSELIPEQVHCSSQVILKRVNSPEFDLYLVDEYVDREQRQSSLKLVNLVTDKRTVYFNEISAPGKVASRKFIAYDLASDQCQSLLIKSWPLAAIRNVVISILPIEQLSREMCDVSLGPSMLLLAVERNMKDFKYLKRDFSQSTLSRLEFYELILGQVSGLVAKKKSLVITVRVFAQAGTKDEQKPSTLADAVITNNGKKTIDFQSITICEVDNTNLKYRTPGEEYDCPDEEGLMNIEYNTITNLVQRSLVGRTIEETSNFDFHRDPFMQPIGIGCWKDSALVREQSFSASSQQFSALYSTTNGSQELNYVAFDGYGRLLRLDRDKTKSVYDLDRRMSYHSRQQRSTDSLIVDTRGSKVSGNCVVLETGDLKLAGPDTLERLLGVGTAGGSAGNQAYYLGTKWIDHVAYRVYETELLYNEATGFNYPILMEASGYTMHFKDAITTRYFMTYYIEEYFSGRTARGTGRQDSQVDDGRDGRGLRSEITLMAPKFIELWEVNSKRRSRLLVNRLEFLQFSWSLDVEPEDDPETSVDSSRVFYVGTCLQERAGQFQVRFRITSAYQPPSSFSTLARPAITALRANKPLIRETIEENLAKALDISRLNIAQVDIDFVGSSQQQQSVNMLVEARLVELVNGLKKENVLLSYAPLKTVLDKMDDGMLAVHHNRHSLDSCKLDSLIESRPNALMFCRGLGLCVLLELEATKKFAAGELQQTEPISREVSTDPEEAACELHQFDWAPSPALHMGLAGQVKRNLFELTHYPFEIKFKFVAERNRLAEYAKYNGAIHAVSMKQLDSVGAAGSAGGFGPAPLRGLRYATAQEDTKSINMNVIEKLDGIRDGDPAQRFRYCQMACQLDEYCQSFSICARRKSKDLQSHADCILSPMPLTSENIEMLSAASRIRAANGADGQSQSTDEQALEITRTREGFASWVYRFKRDLDCDIRPKDVMGAYKMVAAFKAPSKKKETTGAATDDDDVTVSLDGLTLGDCAALCHDQSLMMVDGAKARFTYCPLSSSCTLQQTNQIYGGQVQPDEQCHTYGKTHRQFYTRKRFTRYSSTDQGDKLKTSTATPLEARATEAIQPADTLVSKSIKALNAEDCARDCNLRRSNCLAFDSCRPQLIAGNAMTMPLCTLYSIRSPLSSSKLQPAGGQAELLKLEQEHLSSYKLVGDTACDHYALNGVYFDIRLREMVQSQRDSESSSVAASEENQARNEQEDAVIEQDQRRGSEALDGIIGWLADINNGRGSAATSGANWLFVFIGLFLGCCGFIYAPEMSVFVTDKWDTCKHRWQDRHLGGGGRRLSRQELANSLEV